MTMPDDAVDHIHVAFALHDATGEYARHVGAAMCSLFANATGAITAHLMHDDTLTPESSDKFQALARACGQRIVLHHVGELVAGLPLEQQASLRVFSPATLSRLFLPRLLPDVGRVIYLDGDIIVDLNIAALWTFDLQGQPLAATPDLGVVRARHALALDPGCDQWAAWAISRWHAVGVPLDGYFNAGVLLLDLDRIRTQGLFEQAIAFLHTHADLPCPDQDALNSVFAGKSAVLPFCFNVMLSVHPLYCAGPCIWHYASMKPWGTEDVPRKERYALYLAHTPWGDRSAGEAGGGSAPSQSAAPAPTVAVPEAAITFAAAPLAWLGLEEGQPLMLCAEHPAELSTAARDMLARILARAPQVRVVFCLPRAATGSREQRAALRGADAADCAQRAALRGAVAAACAPHGADPAHCLVLCEDATAAVFAVLLPLAAAVLECDAPGAWRTLPGGEQDGVPLLRAALAPELVAQVIGQGARPVPGADAFVEAALSMAAHTPHGVALAARAPQCVAVDGATDADDLCPLLLDMTADEDARVALTVTAPDGRATRVSTRGVDLTGQVDAFYGRHRSGWAYVTDGLRDLHNPHAPYFETFVERRFSWGAWMGEQLTPLRKPWIGIVHVPLSIPPWFGQSNVCTEIVKTPAWQISAPYCRGLFTLSRSLLEQLRTVPELRDMPMDVLMHPTEFVDAHWSPEAFLANSGRALVQIGSTYRNLHGIHNVPPGPYRKWLAMGGSVESFRSLYMQEEQVLCAEGLYQPGADAQTEFLEFLDAAAYDAVFTQNVIFAEYYAASATNLVLECIARHTPLIVNPLPAIVEYLGENYPLYCTTYAEAGAKAADVELILAAHHSLAAMDKHRFTREQFVESLLHSPVYAGL